MLGKFDSGHTDDLPDGTRMGLLLEGACVPTIRPGGDTPGSEPVDLATFQQVRTMPTSLERAAARTAALRAEAHRLMDAERFGALCRLWEANPDLGFDPELTELLLSRHSRNQKG